MAGQRALITGATGFVGSRLAAHLGRLGWHVGAVVRPESDCSLLDDAVVLHEHAGTNGSMVDLLADAKPDVVFHLASLFLSEHQPKDVERLVESNLLFGTQLAEAMSQTGAYALVNTGTSWQHYEHRSYSPVNLYAATKQAFEDLLQFYIEARGMRVITLQLFDTYGPGDPRPKLINLLRRSAANNELLAMSPGRQVVDLVHVDDVVRAFAAAAERLLSVRDLSHEVYAVSSGYALSLRELVKKVEAILGRDLPIRWGGRPYRAREVMQLWQGPSLPGWMPQVSLEQGLAETLASKRDDSLPVRGRPRL